MASDIKLVFYSSTSINSCFIISLLYASTHFERFCAHHQDGKIVLYGIWYHHTCKWPTIAQDGTGQPPTGVMIPDAV